MESRSEKIFVAVMGILLFLLVCWFANKIQETNRVDGTDSYYINTPDVY